MRTGRLLLRRPDASDAPAAFRIDGDPATNRYNPSGPYPDLATSEDALRRWLGHWDTDGYGYWAVAVYPDPEVIGFGGVRRLSWRDRDVLNLYYRFAPSAWGQGYATEMARMAVHLARTHLPHLPIIARIRAANIPSQRTALRAGLARRPDLDTEDHLAFALGCPPEGSTAGS